MCVESQYLILNFTPWDYFLPYLPLSFHCPYRSISLGRMIWGLTYHSRAEAPQLPQMIEYMVSLFSHSLNKKSVGLTIGSCFNVETGKHLPPQLRTVEFLREYEVSLYGTQLCPPMPHPVPYPSAFASLSLVLMPLLQPKELIISIATGGQVQYCSCLQSFIFIAFLYPGRGVYEIFSFRSPNNMAWLLL